METAMKNYTFKRLGLAAALPLTLAGLVLSASPARANTYNRTWVASNGSDSNPCTRSKPCATFQGALSKTAPGGEVDVVDSAEYGPLNITFSVTIDGGDAVGRIGTLALSTTCGPSFAICVSTGNGAGPVVLRNLAVNTNTVAPSVAIISSGPVFLERMTLQSTQVNADSSQVIIKDTAIREGSLFIHAPNNSILENVTMTGGGISCANGGNLSLRHVTVTNTGYGIYNDGCLFVHVDSSLIIGNGTGITSINGIVTLSDSTVSFNQVGLSPGDIVSFGNNRITANVTNGSPAVTPLL
jgi:hypothetical protein